MKMTELELGMRYNEVSLLPDREYEAFKCESSFKTSIFVVELTLQSEEEMCSMAFTTAFGLPCRGFNVPPCKACPCAIRFRLTRTSPCHVHVYFVSKRYADASLTAGLL